MSKRNGAARTAERSLGRADRPNSSGRARVSAAKRLMDARRRKGARSDPFVWLRADWLSAAACTLPPAELRVVMALQRWWRPHTKASLAYGQIAAMTGLARKTISAALKALEG